MATNSPSFARGGAAAATGEARQLPAAVMANEGVLVRHFAYGSNLQRSKLEGRGKDGVTLRVSDCHAAAVDGYRLAMKLYGFPPFEPAMATIEPYDGAVCEGALYYLPRTSYERLFATEGGSGGGYAEVVVRCRLLDEADGAHEVDAITLQAKDPLPLDAPCSERYKAFLVDGAAELGLSDAYRAKIAAIPTVSPRPFWLLAVCHCHSLVVLSKLRLLWFARPFRAVERRLYRASMSSGMLARAATPALSALLLPSASCGAALGLLDRAARLVGAPPLVDLARDFERLI